jgi:hypothetical protein
MKRKYFFSIGLLAYLSFCSLGICSAEPYVKNPFVKDSTWENVQPYLLPADHPVKPILDKLFSLRRVTTSHQAMKELGFSYKPPRTNQHLTAAKHPKLKGYLIKIFLDTQDLKGREQDIWMHRIQGAQVIEKSIQAHHYEHLMKVPKKWIYPLPGQPSSQAGAYRQNFILVVEDMDIYKYRKNKEQYLKSMTKEMIDALYIIIAENLLIDSIYIDNIPFSTDGRIAFIDTEHFLTKRESLKLHRLGKHFSPIMRQYWRKLLENGGPVDVIPEDWKFDKNKLKSK